MEKCQVLLMAFACFWKCSFAAMEGFEPADVTYDYKGTRQMISNGHTWDYRRYVADIWYVWGSLNGMCRHSEYVDVYEINSVSPRTGDIYLPVGTWWINEGACANGDYQVVDLCNLIILPCIQNNQRYPSTICEGAFANSKIKVLKLPNADIRTPCADCNIVAGAFEGCAIETFHVPNYVTSLDTVCSGAQKTIEAVVLNAGVTSMNLQKLLYGCSELKKLSFPLGFCEIGEMGLSDLRKLADVDLSEDLERIGAKAFYRCWALKTITLPAAVKNIGREAFAECSSLEKIVFTGDRPTIDESLTDQYLRSKIVLHVNAQAKGWQDVKASGIWLGHPVVFYNVADHTLTFDPAGGTCAESSRLVKIGEVVGELPIPVKDGYKFLGWFASPEGGNRYDADMLLETDVSLYAHWEKRVDDGTCEVRFDADPNSASSFKVVGIVKVKRGTSLGAELYVQMSSNAKFAGWFTEVAGGERVTADTVVTSDVTFYAHWEDRGSGKIVYFDANGGQCPTLSYDVEENASVGELPVATRAGYRFLGWYSARGSSTKQTEETKVSEDVVWYAHWGELFDGITVAFNPNGGTVAPSSKTYSTGEAFGELPIPERSGYLFAGWSRSPDYWLMVEADDVVESGGMTLYAFWEDEPPYHLSGGYKWFYEEEDDAVRIYGVLPAPTGDITIPSQINGKCVKWLGFGPCGDKLPGLNFSGVTAVCLPSTLEFLNRMDFEDSAWYESQNSKIVSLGKWGIRAPRGSKTNEALVLPQGITRLACGFAEYGDGPTDGTMPYETLTLPDGLTHICSQAFSGQYQLKDVHMPSSVRVIGAYAFDEVPGPFYFHGNKPSIVGCEGSSLKHYDDGENVTAFGSYDGDPCVVYFREGATGWSDGESWAGAIVRRWPKVTIAFDSNGGWIDVQSKTYEVQLPYGALPTPKKNGSTFMGWFTSASGGSAVTDMTVVSDGVRTLYAHWDVQLRFEIVGEIVPLPSDNSEAMTYNGYLYDEELEQGSVVGTIQVKAAKAKVNKKSGSVTSKITISIQLANETKKVSITGEYDIVAGGEQTFTKNGQEVTLLLGSNGIIGTFGGYVIEGVPNIYLAKDAQSKAKASAADAAYVGSYNIISDEGSFAVAIAKKGKVKVTGSTSAGKAVNASAQLIVGANIACAPIILPKVGLAFTVWLGDDSSVDGLSNAVIGPAGTLRSGARFSLDASELVKMIGDSTYADYFPTSISLSQSGTKWIVADGAKAGKVVLNKAKTGVDEVKLGGNPSALKLTYIAKTGVFKGSFKAYINANGKPKALSATVSGVLINGVGYGTATIKKYGSVDIEIR